MSHIHHSYASFEQLVENTWPDQPQHELAFILASMYLTAKSWAKASVEVAAAKAGSQWRIHSRAPLKRDAVFPLAIKTVDLARTRFDDATSPNAPSAIKTRARQIRNAILVYEVDELVNWVNDCLDQVDSIGVHMTAKALQEPEKPLKGSASTTGSSGIWANLPSAAVTSGSSDWQKSTRNSLRAYESNNETDDNTFLHLIPLAKQLVSYYEQNTALQSTQQPDFKSTVAKRIVRVGAPTWIPKWDKYLYYGVAELADKKQVPAVFWSEYGCYEGLQDLKIEPLNVKSYADGTREFAYTDAYHVGINLDYAQVLEIS